MFKIKRNDYCWCGSQKKLKKCHMDFMDKLQHLRSKGYEMPTRSLIKSAKDIAGIKKSSALTHKLLDELHTIIEPGITTDEINTWVHNETIKHGAIPAPLHYRGFPKSICTSLNNVICHGIPDNTVLKKGDILNVDITCIIDGYFGDSCRMYPVGTISDKAQKLITVTKECLDLAIQTIKPLQPINVIGDAIQAHAHKHNYSVVECFGGHGVGNAFHEDPFIYHYKRSDKQMIMVPGMVFTIEPMINEGGFDCEILDDDWTAVTTDGSLSAQWEHTVLVTETGVEVLT
jgi:methionyl aminopeptidase